MNLVARAGESRLIHCQPRNQNHLMTAYRRRKCRPNKAFTPHPAVVLGWAYKMHVLGSHHYLLLRRSSATSTIISSWPPTIRRLPSSTRISTALKP
ncbi:hypothetical protein BON87_15545 [Escherichia coli]|nr:hypothetical protein BTW13_18005 [Escherichia coli]TFA24189.1 hypothetical protein BON87_15545 [Escherichia coli]